MSDLYLEALQNYLNGPEWRSSIDDFIRTYCQYFVQINSNSNQLQTGKFIETFDVYRVISIVIIDIIMIIIIMIVVTATIIINIIIMIIIIIIMVLSLSA
jgi:hypothetical protein